MMKYLLKHIRECITIVAQIVIGILLLVNPSIYAVSLIRILGVLLILRGGIRIIHYLQKEAAEAAEGEEFATGLMAVTLGLFCIFGQNWWSEAFPALAVVYGLFQLLLGYQKIQKTADCLRLHKKLWYFPGICALLYLIFGFVIVLNPGMSWISVWVFTGIALIIEAVMEAVTIICLRPAKV